MPADLRTLEKRITTLEQAAEAQQAASTGIQSDALRFDEKMALIYKLVPVQDGERVRQILRGELHVIFPPNYGRDLEHLSVEELRAHPLRQRCMCIRKDSAYHSFTGELRPHYKEQIDNGWCVLECEDTETCGHSPAVERQRLLATGAYVEPDAPG